MGTDGGIKVLNMMHSCGFGSSVFVLSGAEMVSDVDKFDRKRGKERFFDIMAVDRKALE
jgi:hypothetical protein